MAAIGYFSNDRDINEGTRAVLNIDEATPALQRLQPAVTAIAKVCIALLFLSSGGSTGGQGAGSRGSRPPRIFLGPFNGPPLF